MSIKGILFDADGVVINSEMFSVKYQKMSGVKNEDMLPFFLGEFINTIEGKADLMEIITPRLPKWKWDKPVIEFLKYWFISEHKTDKKVIDSINKLKSNGIKCFLATNQEQYRTSYMKNEMGFEKLFDFVFSSCELGYKKPEDNFYLKILDTLENNHGINKEEILFFDDSKKNVNKANELGIKSYLYTNYEEYEKIINKLN